jgi:ATP/maltotriose-dependent transcriptional regulator MalT
MTCGHVGRQPPPLGSAETGAGDAMADHGELLATKLNIPKIRRDHLVRSRLIDRLDQGLAHKLILVCTPAGFGKTTLLADWASTGASVGWFSLDPQDNDPMRFWRYVVQCARPHLRRPRRTRTPTAHSPRRQGK